MKTKIAIIAFGEIATVVAHYKLSLDKTVEVTSRTCIHGLSSVEDAELCVRNILHNHKQGESYLFLSARDGLSKMYAQVAMKKIPGYPCAIFPIHGEHLELHIDAALDEEYGQPVFQRAFNDLWKKARPKNSKRERREFRGEGGFPVGFFTPGTKCVIDIGHGFDGPREIEIAALASNGPNSYVAVTNRMNSFTESRESFHISHVKEIISHKPGRLKFESYSSTAEAKKRHDKDFKRMSDSGSTGIRDKHHSQYRTYSPDILVITLLRDMVKDDQTIDTQKLTQQLVAENIFQVIKRGDGDWGIRIYTVNKKKLKKAIHRLFNKCLVPIFQQEVQRREDDNRFYDEEMRRDMERDFPEGDEVEDNTAEEIVQPEVTASEDSDTIYAKMGTYVLGDDVDIGDQVREGLEDVLSPYEQRMEDTHNRLLDEEAEMERYGVTSMADLLLEKVADDWVQAASSYPVNPSLGDLLREKIARDAGKDGKVVLVMDVPENEVGNRADIIFDGGSTIAKLNMTPETIRLVTELNDGVFGKGNWENGLTPHTADIEAMRDAEVTDTEFEQMKSDNEKSRERITEAYAIDADGKKHDMRDLKVGVDLFIALNNNESIWNEPQSDDKDKQ